VSCTGLNQRTADIGQYRITVQFWKVIAMRKRYKPVGWNKGALAL
jgi:hypothetical protein